MVYPSRLENLKAEELEDIEIILQQKDFLSDLSWYIKRKQGKDPEELE